MKLAVQLALNLPDPSKLSFYPRTHFDSMANDEGIQFPTYPDLKGKVVFCKLTLVLPQYCQVSRVICALKSHVVDLKLQELICRVYTNNSDRCWTDGRPEHVGKRRGYCPHSLTQWGEDIWM